MDLSTATPAEIDEQLARIGAAQGKALADIERSEELIARYQDDPRYARSLTTAEKKLAEAQQHYDEAVAEAAAYEAEWTRRVGWTRAFLATSTNGHIHRTRSCSTCRVTTTFYWFTVLSGRSEAEIVELAGERACTVCYPSAPVEVLSRPTQLFSEDEVEAQKAREERAAAKDAREAKRIEKALVEPIRVDREKIETLAAAKSRLTDNRLYIQLGWNGRSDYEAASRTLAEAIARKTGESVEAIIAAADKRAEKRR